MSQSKLTQKKLQTIWSVLRDLAVIALNMRGFLTRERLYKMQRLNFLEALRVHFYFRTKAMLAHDNLQPYEEKNKCTKKILKYQYSSFVF